MKNSKGHLRRLIRTMKPYGGLAVLSLLTATATVAAQLMVPVITGDAIDCMVAEGRVDFAVLGILLLRIGLLVGVSALAQWLLAASNNRIAFSLSRDLRKQAIGKIQRLPLRYLDNHPAGDLVSRIISDVETVSDGVLMSFSQLFTGVLTILGTLGIMASRSLLITAVVVLLTPLSLFVAAYISRRTFRWFQAQSATRGEATSYINEIMDGQRVVKAFGQERASREAFDEVNERLKDASLKAVFYSSLTNPSTRLVNNLVYAAVALAGGLMAIAGSLTIGQVSMFLSFASQYAKPFNEISGVVTELQNALACAGRVFELLDEKEECREEDEDLDAAGAVELDHVSFRYVPERPLIEDFSLRVKQGQRVAIVGPTGCGKTTLINLLMRFYDVDEGAIRVDGRDIRTLRRHALRRSIGMVLQDTWLKSGTIRDSIAFGKPEASEEEIVAAAKAAHIHSFIRRLPGGYDTQITENGENMSQGQKQLLCIARVMLCLPPMLILDEATSSIDTRTEVKIQAAFAGMMKGRTSFIVAHRLSTIREADVILVMRDGHIVEQGNHGSLMARNGFYAALYNSQFGK